MKNIAQVRGLAITVATLLALAAAPPFGARGQSPAAGSPPSDSVGVGTQHLTGYRRPDFATAPLVGPLDPSAVLTLAIGLPVRNRGAFDALARSLSDPKSPSYRRFLTPEQTVARFSPTAADYDAVAAFARAHGLTVVRSFANRYLLDVRGTVEIVEQAFHVKMNLYRRPDGSAFFAPDREPSLDLAVPVLHIAGLENFVLPRLHQMPFQGTGPQLPGPPPQNTLIGADLRNVYTGNSATLYGQGQTIGLLEFATPIQSDIYGLGTPDSGYNSYLPLPAGQTSAPPVSFWPATSTWSPVLAASTPQQQVDSVAEADLDVEMAMAIAPGLQNIVVYVAMQDPATNFAGQVANAALIDDALDAMASPDSGVPLSLQLSASLNWISDPAAQQIVTAMAVQGQSFFVASGDIGSYNAPGSGCQPSYSQYGYDGINYYNDIALDNVTVVGGTLFATASGAPYGEGEIAWSTSSTLSSWPYLFANDASGGGIIIEIPQPGYQAGLTANGASTTNRNVPDVAAVADELWYIFNGLILSGAGTSAATPLWAGYTALVNQQRQTLGFSPGLGFLNPSLYSLAGATGSPGYLANFHDVVSGNNGVGSCPGFAAGPGYDLVTGLGSPTGALIGALAALPRTASSEGDPHLITIDGLPYDFQSAGEFVALRDGYGMQIQTRQTAVPIAAPITDPHTGLTACVSVNTAVAAQVGTHRVTYEPSLSSPAQIPNAPQLRVDGVLKTLGAHGLALTRGGRITPAPAGTGIEIDFPDGTVLSVTSHQWIGITWFLNVDVLSTQASQGLLGATAPGSWLPALANGNSVGPPPATYATLYGTYADAWRVTNATSLFEYAPGKSTATFTNTSWPPESGPCLSFRPPRQLRVERTGAEKLCRTVVGAQRNANCIADTVATGAPAFAESYRISQRIAAGATAITVTDDTGPTRVGDAAAFTATVAPRTSSGGSSPTGTVRFTLDGAAVGKPVTLDANGQARWTTRRLAVGEYLVTADYVPDERSVFLASSSLETPHAVVEPLPK